MRNFLTGRVANPCSNLPGGLQILSPWMAFLKLGGQSPAGSGGGQEGGRGPGSLLWFGDVHSEFQLQRNVPRVMTTAHYLGRFLHSRFFIPIAGQSQAR